MRSTRRNGGSLWSAGARDRFGSHLRILRTPSTRDTVGFLLSLPQYRSGLPKRSRAPALQRLRRFDLCARFRYMPDGKTDTVSFDSVLFVATAQTAEGRGVSSLARTHTQAQSAEARCKLSL